MLEVVNEQYESVPIGQLAQHPRNPREGDVGAIAESIRHNGFYGAVVAQRSTGHVLAGNHRIKAAHDVGMKEVPVLWVDVDDETALRILLADNRTNDLASYNEGALTELLTELADSIGLQGTGYDGDDLDELLGEYTDAFAEWTDMPDFESDDLHAAFRTHIHFPTEDDAEAFFALIKRKKTKSLWWPKDDEHVGSDVTVAYVSENE